MFLWDLLTKKLLTRAMRAGPPGMRLSYLSKCLLYFSQVLGSELG